MGRFKQRRNRRGSRPQSSMQAVAETPMYRVTSEPAEPSVERWVGVDEMAERLGVSPRTIRNWEKRGLIALRRIGPGGRLVGMTESGFVSWMESQGEEGGDDGQPDPQ